MTVTPHPRPTPFLRRILGLFQPAWPQPAPDLSRHPQLAVLSALHATAHAAAFALAAAPPQASTDRIVRGAADRLMGVLDDLVVTLDDYHQALRDGPSSP